MVLKCGMSMSVIFLSSAAMEREEARWQEMACCDEGRKVNAVCFISDEYLATASTQKAKYLLNVWPVTPVQSASASIDPKHMIFAVIRTPQAKDSVTTNGLQKITLWDLVKAQAVSEIQYDKTCNAIDYSFDARLASGYSDGTCKIWDTRKPSCHGAAEFKTDEKKPLWDIQWGPGRDEIATCSKHVVTIWDVRKNNEPLKRRSFTVPLHHVLYSPEGMRLVIAAQNYFEEVNPGSLESMSSYNLRGERIEKCTPFIEEECPSALAFTSDIERDTVVLGTSTGYITARDLNDLESKSYAMQHMTSIDTLDVSPDGSMIAAGSCENEAAKIYKIPKREKPKKQKKCCVIQ